MNLGAIGEMRISLSVPLFVEALNKIVACLHQVELQHQLQDS